MFKPTKYQLFGIINLLSCILPVYLLFESLTALPAEISFQLFIHTYLPDIVLALVLVINLIIFYRIVVKKQVQDFKLNVIWTLFSLLWQLLMFFGYFFASDIRFLALSFLLVALIFYFIQKISLKSAYAITIITIIVIIMTIMFGFEEDYCWAKGDEAQARLAPGASEMIQATKEDAEKLDGAAGMNFKEGDEIGIGFRAHFLCHNDFNFAKALKEKYLSY